MNRLASDNKISQAFSKALKGKFTSSLKVKSDFRKEILYMSINHAEIVY